MISYATSGTSVMTLNLSEGLRAMIMMKYKSRTINKWSEGVTKWRTSKSNTVPLGFYRTDIPLWPIKDINPNHCRFREYPNTFSTPSFLSLDHCCGLQSITPTPLGNGNWDLFGLQNFRFMIYPAWGNIEPKKRVVVLP